MELVNKTKFLNNTGFIIRLLYKHSYELLQALYSVFYFTERTLISPRHLIMS